MKTEAVAHLLLSVIGSAVIAGLVTFVGNGAFNQHFEFLVMWAICFALWWGVIVVGEC